MAEERRAAASSASNGEAEALDQAQRVLAEQLCACAAQLEQRLCSHAAYLPGTLVMVERIGACAEMIRSTQLARRAIEGGEQP